MSKHIVSKIKGFLPEILKIATDTLSFIEKEVLNVPKGISANVRKSGDKIIIDVTLPGVSKDDLNISYTQNGFSIAISNCKET